MALAATTASEDCPTKGEHGTFCWNERLARDVEAAKKFYSFENTHSD